MCTVHIERNLQIFHMLSLSPLYPLFVDKCIYLLCKNGREFMEYFYIIVIILKCLKS